MTNVEIIKDMIERQKKLDVAMYGSNSATYNRENTRLALIDELGELNHELKATWCWWKKTQAPVDRDKALGELVDLWHFALNIFYHEYPHVTDDYLSKMVSVDDFDIRKTSMSIIYFSLIDLYQDNWILRNMLILSMRLDFTLEEVYEAYKAKNEINYERIRNNY